MTRTDFQQNTGACDFPIDQNGTVLETHCKARGFSVIFLLKFHCELNFIKQCWGYAKQIYHHFPPSSKEADLKANLLKALELVPLTSMQQFVIFCLNLNAYFTHSKQFCVDLQLALRDLLMLMIRVLLSFSRDCAKSGFAIHFEW